MAELTIDDIRLFLIDRDADDNYLLDDTEFGDEQITRAMSMCVDRFNEMTPLTGILTELPRHLWTIGTAAILLRMKAINLVRNRLDYQQKSGTAVQDKAKAPEYLALARELMNEFDAKARSLKVAQNIEAGYGYFGSPMRTIPSASI